MKTHRITPNTIIFQTGNRYDEHGQVIIATLREDKLIQFRDISRQIDGVVHTDLYSVDIYKCYSEYGYSGDFSYPISRELRKLADLHIDKVTLKKVS